MPEHDRDPTRPTEEVPSTEPIAPSEPTAPPPPGGYASLRRGGGIAWQWVAAGVSILLVAFALGFFIGNQDDEPPVRQAGDQREGGRDGGGGGDRQGDRQGGNQRGGGQRGGGGGGRRRACNQALDLGQQTIQVHQELLANRTAFVEALLAEDTGRIEALNAAADELLIHGEEVQAQYDQAVARCRA
jgi:hypothetical protein